MQKPYLTLGKTLMLLEPGAKCSFKSTNATTNIVSCDILFNYRLRLCLLDKADCFGASLLCAENTTVWEHKEATSSVDEADLCHHPPASFFGTCLSNLTTGKKGPSGAFFISLLLNVARPSDASRQLLTLNFEIWSLTKDQLSDCSIDRRLGEQFTSPVLIFFFLQKLLFIVYP